MSEKNEKISIWDIDPVSSILQKVHFQFTTKRLRSISVASENRAEGKTTLAILLARGLNEIYGFKVLLVDLNSQGDSLLSKYLKDYQTKDGFVLNSNFPFAVFRIKDLDIDWSKNIYDGPFVNRLITNFTSNYDIVIVDNPTSTNPLESILKINTDTNLIISKQSNNALNRLTKELELNHKHLLGVVFNKTDGK